MTAERRCFDKPCDIKPTKTLQFVFAGGMRIGMPACDAHAAKALAESNLNPKE